MKLKYVGDAKPIPAYLLDKSHEGHKLGEVKTGIADSECAVCAAAIADRPGEFEKLNVGHVLGEVNGGCFQMVKAVLWLAVMLVGLIALVWGVAVIVFN